jgi:hypothetical protein
MKEYQIGFSQNSFASWLKPFNTITILSSS